MRCAIERTAVSLSSNRNVGFCRTRIRGLSLGCCARGRSSTCRPSLFELIHCIARHCLAPFREEGFGGFLHGEAGAETLARNHQTRWSEFDGRHGSRHPCVIALENCCVVCVRCKIPSEAKFRGCGICRICNTGILYRIAIFHAHGRRFRNRVFNETSQVIQRQGFVLRDCM